MANGKLAPHFLAVLNTKADEEGQAIIRHGNARVLRARFKDARFFWDFDQRVPLVERVESLKKVTFQKELGSYDWKTEENLASAAEDLQRRPYNAGVKVDEAALLKAAAQLAKTDLTSGTGEGVYGVAGRRWRAVCARAGLGRARGQAIYDQYTPASMEDRYSDFR